MSYWCKSCCSKGKKERGGRGGTKDDEGGRGAKGGGGRERRGGRGRRERRGGRGGRGRVERKGLRVDDNEEGERLVREGEGLKMVGGIIRGDKQCINRKGKGAMGGRVTEMGKARWRGEGEGCLSKEGGGEVLLGFREGFVMCTSHIFGSLCGGRGRDV